MKWFLLAAGLLLVAAAAFGAWLFGTESGLRWALSHAPRELVVEGPRGKLAGTISAGRIAYRGVEARDVELRISLGALAGGTVVVDDLRIKDLRIELEQEKAETGKSLPFRVRVARALVERLAVQGYELRNLELSYSGDLQGHRLDAAFSIFG